MNARGRINPAIIASLMGHARGTMALDLYSSGAFRQALMDAVADMEALGIPPDVREAPERTSEQRPRMVRFNPRTANLLALPEPSPDRPGQRRKAARSEPAKAA